MPLPCDSIEGGIHHGQEANSCTAAGISVDDLNYLNGGMFTDRDPNSAVRATMRSNEGKYKGRLGTPVTVPDIDKYGKLQAIKDE